MAHARIRHEGLTVQVIFSDGKAVALAWDAALALGQAITYHARLVEEVVKRERVVMDQAILLRAGLWLPLVNDPYLRHQAHQEAAWNSDLRRYLPGGIPSQEEVGRPTIIRHRPRLTKGV